MEEKELVHWGIKGMRWGFRRFQNKDGSLTAAGRKRYDNDKDSDSESSKDKDSPAPKPKTAKEMSNDELNDAIKRLKLEQEYKRLNADVNPEQVSTGKRLVNEFLDKAIIPALQEGGRQAIKDFISNTAKKAWDDGEVSEYDRLKKESELTKFKREIAQNKKQAREADDWLKNRDQDLADRKKRQEERAKKEAEAKKQTEQIINDAKKDAKKANQEEKKAAKQARKDLKQEEKERRDRINNAFKNNTEKVAKSNDDLIKESVATLKEVKAQRDDGIRIVDAWGKTLSTVHPTPQSVDRGRSIIDEILRID